jgi:arsenical pump membrane protein
LTAKRQAPWAILEQISWSVLPLVAGLFILVAGLQKTGVIDQLGEALRQLQGQSETVAIWWASLLVAIADNLINNLPTGLIASAVGATVGAGPRVSGALLMSVDIGPNLSITGSLATILWLIALRREGAELSALRFLKLGIVVMPPALLSAVAASFLIKG